MSDKPEKPPAQQQAPTKPAEEPQKQTSADQKAEVELLKTSGGNPLTQESD